MKSSIKGGLRLDKKTCVISLIQISLSDNKKTNLNKAVQKIKETHQKGAQIIALPELFTTPYFPQMEKAEVSNLAETIPGPTTEALSQLAKELNIVIVAGSIFEKDGDKFYNTATIFNNNGQILGKYRKIHVPYDTYFYETNYFSPGE